MTIEPTESQRERAEWQALTARYPMSHPATLAVPLLSALAANGTLCWLVVTRALSPFELVLMVVIEAILFVLIAWLQHVPVPKASRLSGNPMGWVARLVQSLFALVWLGAMYGMVLFLWYRQGGEARSLVADPWAYLGQSKLWIPVAIAAAGAMVDALLDWQHWRKHGGLFVSTPATTGAARWLTLFLGGIPFMMPMLLILLAISQVAELAKKIVGKNHALPLVLIPVVMLCVAGSMGWMMQSGVSGFAIGYTTAKFAADGLIVFLPWIGKKALTEGLGGGAKNGKRGVLPG